MSVEEPIKLVKAYKPTLRSVESKMCRYNIYRRLINEYGDEYIETPEKIKIKETNKDSFYAVEMGYVNRLDLISNKFYGTPLLWWAIAIVNNIDNPMDVQAGIVLRIPTLRSIYNSGALLVD